MSFQAAASTASRPLPGANVYIHTLIYICLCTYLLVDSVNGFLLKSGGPSVSIVFKMGLAALMMLYLVAKKDVVLIISAMLLIVCMRLLLFPADFDSVIMKMRTMLNIVFFIYFFYF